jgi:glycosyltransferase involved in cell wall biosynthesis
MHPPLISCIVPVFNGERYLKEALDSVLAQTYRPIEVLVVDDGSTDATAAMVASYGTQVRAFWQPNAGPAAARNLGLGAARGEFVAFLDADDLWHTEKLTRQMARFRGRPELDLCVTHARNFWIPELEQEAARYRDHRCAEALPGYYASSLMARRGLFDTVGRYDTSLGHGSQLEWFVRATDHGADIELLPDLLVYRRLHQGNRSRLMGPASRDEFVRILKTFLDRRRLLNSAAPAPHEPPATGRQGEG